MDLGTEDRDGVLVITVKSDRIDAYSAIQFKDSMREATMTDQPRVVIDLASVTFLDSSGLGAVVAAMKALGATRKLELAGLTPPVAKVFRLTRMDSVFVVHKKLADVFDRDASAA